MKKILLILALSASCAHAVHQKEGGTPIGHHDLGHVGKIFAQHKQSKPLLNFVKKINPSDIDSKHLLNNMANAVEKDDWQSFYALAKRNKKINSLLTPWYKKPGIWTGIAGTAAIILAGALGWHKYHNPAPIVHTRVGTLLDSTELPSSVKLVLEEFQQQAGKEAMIAGWSYTADVDVVLVRFIIDGKYYSISGSPDDIKNLNLGYRPPRPAKARRENYAGHA